MKPIFLIFGLGVPEMAVVLFALVFFFGGKKIPQLMRGLGQSIKAFNDGKKED